MSHVREFVARNPKRPHRVLRRRVLTGLVFVAAVDAFGSVLLYRTAKELDLDALEGIHG